MENWKGVAAKDGITTDFTKFEITGLPENAELLTVNVWLENVSGATKVTMYVAHDDDGRQAVTPAGTTGAQQTIQSLTGNYGFVAWTLGAPWVAEDGENPRLFLKTDTGTCDATPRMYARRRSDA